MGPCRGHRRALVPAVAVLTLALQSPGRADPGDSNGQAQRPNILFAISDDQSWPHAGAYGCRFVKTPGFDRVAADGLLFSNCYTPNAKCAPSRACLLTGRNSWQLAAAANHHCFFPKTFRTYPEALGANGYAVGFTGKGWGPGNAQGRDLCGPAFHRRTAPRPTKGISGKDYAANFADFLAQRPAGKPFCFWYGAHEPHRAYEFGTGARLGGKSPEDISRVCSFWPDTDTVRHDMLDYALEIEHFDRHLGRMLDLLAERGELENTLVVVTSDNGMPFPRAKGQAYDVSNHMPLAIMWPRGIGKPGRVIDHYVSFIDIAPTFLEAAGLGAAAAGMQPMQGRSLCEFFPGEPPSGGIRGRDWVIIGKEMHDTGRPGNAIYPIRGLIREDYLYVRNYAPNLWPAGNPECGYPNTDGGATKTVILNDRRAGESERHWDLCFGQRPAEELYSLRWDRDCTHNLAGVPAYAQRVADMSALLTHELEHQRDPRTVGPPGYFEAFPSTNRTWNLRERLEKGETVRCGWLSPTDREPFPR